MPGSRRRLIDQIADASVLVPAALGALCVANEVSHYGKVTSASMVVFAVYGGMTVLLHLWFRAEDRWRRRRLLREAMRRRR